MPEINQPRPPYVTFELRPEEDRAQTLESGSYVAIDVPYAIITPQGSKDRIERKVDEWFPQLDQQAREGRIPAEWVRGFKADYTAWVAGNEIPEKGHPVKSWPAASPAQIKTLITAGLRTVEDVAAANEEAIMRLGMGGRALKQRAEEWLHSAANGRKAEEFAALRVKNESLENSNTDLRKRIEALEKLLPAKA